ncbi:MAG: flagellar motor switch protein FliM [Schwartzia sp.]|nr:flagellar motor switch protein FliM [Schwartzia sp. (in: firmicutes)]
MADDVLSQSEIDKLLSALSSGDVDANEMKAEEEQKKIKVYDFKRPDKFSKDQIRTLQMLHENFGRMLNTYLSTNLRSLVDIDVASVEQLTYQEFIQSLANPSVIGVLAVPPLKGNIIMELNTSIAFSIIDRVFGGTGANTVKPRTLTEIEEAVIRRTFSKAIDNFKEAWENVVQMRPRLEVMESNPAFVQIVPPSDMVVIITLKIQIGEVEGFMNICIPYLVLEPIMSKLTTTFWVASSVNKEQTPEQVATLERKIARTRVPLIVEMGKIEISIREFLTLGFGDVLQLDTKVKDELPVLIGKKRKFFCRPGTFGKKAAIQITRVAPEGDEESDE